MFKVHFNSIWSRVLLGAFVLLAMLCFMASIAVWRAQNDEDVRETLELRASASATIERARAELFLVAALAVVSAISEDPEPTLAMYDQQWAAAEEALLKAHSELAEIGDEVVLTVYEATADQIAQFKANARQAVDAMHGATREERLARSPELQAELQPQIMAAVTQLSSIAERQRAEMVNSRAEADATSKATLWTLLGTTALCFLVGLGIAAFLTNSVLRPLASLQKSVRAIASGDLKAEVEISGPEEVRSLGNDFNRMLAARREAEEALRHQAATDSLTGIYNHRSLHELLSREVDRGLRHNHAVAILMMDMDGFKLFNDTYGHQEGDRVLARTAEILKAAMRAHDIVGRYGGDEFMAILPETERDEAIACANRILQAVSAERIRPRKGGELPLAISIGLAVCPEDTTHKEELIAYADASLMEAKQIAGGNLVVAHRQAEDALTQRRTPFGVLDALVRAVDRKDRYTRQHSQQNAEYAVELGKAIGLSEGTVNALRIAGLLHDVGKIGVPDDILRKPGALTDDEQAIMREHVTLSNLIVHGVPNLQDVSAAVYSHHERWDGTGYPRGLKGEEIPLAGRIMALVDAYSAMILDRPYRKALTQEEAAGELRRHTGTQFDPDLVEPFVKVLETGLRAAA